MQNYIIDSAQNYTLDSVQNYTLDSVKNYTLDSVKNYALDSAQNHTLDSVLGTCGCLGMYFDPARVKRQAGLPPVCPDTWIRPDTRVPG